MVGARLNFTWGKGSKRKRTESTTKESLWLTNTRVEITARWAPATMLDSRRSQRAS